MNHLDEMLFKIRYEMKVKGISSGELAKALGYSKTTISNILNGRNGTFESVKKILEYLKSKGGVND